MNDYSARQNIGFLLITGAKFDDMNRQGFFA